MHEVFLRAYVPVRTALGRLRARAGEAGEGVISAAIAVLIMAFLGAGMWLAFNQIFTDTARNTCNQAKNIGGAGNTMQCQ